MAGCERCWGQAYTLSRCNDKSQVENYHDLLKKNEGKCTPEQQAGDWWDEEKKVDRRFVGGEQGGKKGE